MILEKILKLALELKNNNLIVESDEVIGLVKVSGKPLPIPSANLVDLSSAAARHIIMRIIFSGISPLEFLMRAVSFSEDKAREYGYNDFIEITNIAGEEVCLGIAIFFTNDEEMPPGRVIHDVKAESLRSHGINVPSGYEFVKILEIGLKPKRFLPKKEDFGYVLSLGAQGQINVFENYLTNAIFDILTHEFTHSIDVPISKDSPSFDRYQRLYGQGGTDFYFTTREELKAFINQIAENTIATIFDHQDEFLNGDFLDYFRKYNPLFNVILYKLEVRPGDEEIPVIQGNLKQRKERARKYFLSTLHTWWVHAKERVRHFNEREG